MGSKDVTYDSIGAVIFALISVPPDKNTSLSHMREGLF